MDTAAAFAPVPSDEPHPAHLHLVDADPEQLFVSQLRSSATHFAAAAGAQSAVVREAVPPARHRRSRCRVVLQWDDGAESDVTFLGPARRPVDPSRGPAALTATTSGFDAAIQAWLTEGRPESPLWLVPDEDSPAGTAVDVAAWLSL